MTFPLPHLDDYEERILEEVISSNGGIFRTELRLRMGGSNTTFIKKISNLKKKGILEETKKRPVGNGRLKTFYRLTEFAIYLFGLKKVLDTNNWFTASHKVELFPEFRGLFQTLSVEDLSIYGKPDMESRHLILETFLATSKKPELENRELKELLIMCSAFLQNLLVDKVHTRVRDRLEGYLIFHYKLYKPNEQYRALAEHITNYMKTENPLTQHKSASDIIELIINYPKLSVPFTMMALKIALSMRFSKEAKSLLRAFKSYRKKEEPIQLTRIQLVISALNIYKKLYDTFREKVLSLSEQLELEV